MKVGDKVRFVNAEVHDCDPYCYPPVGTIGTVLSIDGDDVVFVQWPGGSTLTDDRWWSSVERLELVEGEKKVKKYKVTLCNSEYPLSRECDDIYEAFKTIEAMRRVHESDEMPLVMKRLVDMQEGKCLSFSANGYQIELVEEKEVKNEKVQSRRI